LKSVCGDQAESQAALTRALEELAQARERIAELEARLRQNPRNPRRAGQLAKAVHVLQTRQIAR
jgi:thioredoxin-like negative regulator of GroEL